MRRSPLWDPLLYLPSKTFEGLVFARNKLFDAGAFEKRRVPAPVISVGNLSMGGTGKTPLVIYIAQKILALGFTPAVLTRGYGRSSTSAPQIVFPAGTAPNPVSEMGDEPALIRRKVQKAWLGVASDRYRTGLQILERDIHKPVFILDDGFQHRKIQRDLDMVVIDAEQPPKNNRMIPLGSLREPLSSLERAHAILVNCSATSVMEFWASQFRHLHSSPRIFCCRQPITGTVPFESWLRDTNIPPEPDWIGSAFLVAAIGNPRRFRSAAEEAGIHVVGHLFFRDHHNPRPDEWEISVREARRLKADAILITEKDAIKLHTPTEFPLRVAIQSTCIESEESFIALLSSTVEGA